MPTDRTIRACKARQNARASLIRAAAYIRRGDVVWARCAASTAALSMNTAKLILSLP